VAGALLGLWPSTDGASIRFAVGAVVTWAWVAALATWLRTIER
jgi:hypothetical protein